MRIVFILGRKDSAFSRCQLFWSRNNTTIAEPWR